MALVVDLQKGHEARQDALLGRLALDVERLARRSALHHLAHRVQTCRPKYTAIRGFLLQRYTFPVRLIQTRSIVPTHSSTSHRWLFQHTLDRTHTRVLVHSVSTTALKTNPNENPQRDVLVDAVSPGSSAGRRQSAPRRAPWATARTDADTPWDRASRLRSREFRSHSQRGIEYRMREAHRVERFSHPSLQEIRDTTQTSRPSSALRYEIRDTRVRNEETQRPSICSSIVFTKRTPSKSHRSEGETRPCVKKRPLSVLFPHARVPPHTLNSRVEKGAQKAGRSRKSSRWRTADQWPPVANAPKEIGRERADPPSREREKERERERDVSRERPRERRERTRAAASLSVPTCLSERGDDRSLDRADSYSVSRKGVAYSICVWYVSPPRISRRKKARQGQTPRMLAKDRTHRRHLLSRLVAQVLSVLDSLTSVLDVCWRMSTVVGSAFLLRVSFSTRQLRYVSSHPIWQRSRVQTTRDGPVAL